MNKNDHNNEKCYDLLKIKNIIFDTSISANSIADINGIITECNDSFLKYWGFVNKNEVIGKHISYFFKDPDKSIEVISELNKNNKWIGDFIAKKKDGSTFIANAQSTTLINGAKIGYQSTIYDITQSVTLKESILSNIKKFKDLMEITKTAYLVLSIDGQIKEANSIFLNMVGCKEKHLTGINIFDLLSCDYSSKMKKHISLLEKGIAIEDLEVCIDNLLCEKRGIWISINANIIEDSEKNIIALIRDITSKKIEEFKKYIASQKQKDRVKQSISKIRDRINIINTKQKGLEND